MCRGMLYIRALCHGIKLITITYRLTRCNRFFSRRSIKPAEIVIEYRIDRIMIRVTLKRNYRIDCRTDKLLSE